MDVGVIGGATVVVDTGTVVAVGLIGGATVVVDTGTVVAVGVIVANGASGRVVVVGAGAGGGVGVVGGGVLVDTPAVVVVTGRLVAIGIVVVGGFVMVVLTTVDVVEIGTGAVDETKAARKSIVSPGRSIVRSMTGDNPNIPGGATAAIAAWIKVTDTTVAQISAIALRITVRLPHDPPRDFLGPGNL